VAGYHGHLINKVGTYALPRCVTIRDSSSQESILMHQKNIKECGKVHKEWLLHPCLMCVCCTPHVVCLIRNRSPGVSGVSHVPQQIHVSVNCDNAVEVGQNAASEMVGKKFL